MSTAVYYSNHNMPVEDIHSKHTLPSLSQIMPIGQQQQQQSSQYSHDATLAAAAAAAAASGSSPSMMNHQNPTGQLSPTLVSANMVQNNNMTMFNEQKMVYQTSHQQQPSPDVFSSSSQPSTAHTTPASSFSNGSAGYHNGSIAAPYGAAPNGAGSTEKCVCKSNANRIPRPRNAFILFRQKYHQSVLDEGSVIRTNPEVSRELGRRWRALSAEEKDYWNNLAEEEKKNHAKKYPGYRYTPRRNGKNKNCIACRQKAMRQQQVQVHNQQMIQLQQEQYQQYLQLQQQQQPQQTVQQMQQQQQVMQQQVSNIPQQFNNNYLGGNGQQFVISNPYQQQSNGQVPPGAPAFQFSFNSDLNSSSNNTSAQDKLSPLSNIPYAQQVQLQQQPAGSGATSSSHNNTPPNYHAHTTELMNNSANPQFVIAYDQQQANSGLVHNQRFNSLPTPVNGANGYGFDGFSQQ